MGHDDPSNLIPFGMVLSFPHQWSGIGFLSCLRDQTVRRGWMDLADERFFITTEWYQRGLALAHPQPESGGVATGVLEFRALSKRFLGSAP